MFDIEEKIWELLLVLFGVLLKTALDIAREGHKKNRDRAKQKNNEDKFAFSLTVFEDRKLFALKIFWVNKV